MFQFVSHLNSERPSAVFNANKSAGSIFNKPQSKFKCSYAWDKDADFMAYLRFPGDTKYTMFAPVLYPNLVLDPKTIPQTKILVEVTFIWISARNSLLTDLCTKVPRVISWGMDSLDGGHVSNKTVGKIWRVTEVTSAMIALAACIVSSHKVSWRATCWFYRFKGKVPCVGRHYVLSDRG